MSSELTMSPRKSFFMTKICYRALTRKEFVRLQGRVFPVYFALQTAGTVLMILTYPGHSLGTLLARRDFFPLGAMLATSLLNSLVYGPRTKRAMLDLVEKRADKDGADGFKGESSKEMHVLRRRFSKNHAMSIHLNFIGILASVLYVFTFGARFQLVEAF
ncbi:hypothetical protein MPH_00342 [Macrophomina phaseolina MS6]|uniref:TMEM205-like domain-containing protein n=1 Tax=Macrophomina phaseolina (strain MS6) TaxID=1126212 RepID=K2T031_MACPH|nr:hypothetical protein MPH_00342 [Macrophomina phaseolina MS6]